jgi:outer membrane protein assembly factor BamB
VLGGKSGPVYVLRQDHLGGIGGQVSQQNICPSYGAAAVDGDVVYLPCDGAGDAAVRVDSSGQLHVLWHADGSVHGAPVIGGGRVWALDQTGGVLHALDPKTGKTSAQVDVGETSRFAKPAISGPDVLVPTLAGLTVVRTS